MVSAWVLYANSGINSQNPPADVQAACDRENIPVSHEFTITVRSNITPCFSDPKDMVEDGRLLLDFFTHIADFLRDAPCSQKVQQFLGSDRCSENGDREQVYFNGDWKALIVERSSFQNAGIYKQAWF